MQNNIAFITVLIVWSTTPLAIKLSAMGASSLFAASMRMCIAALFCILILYVKNQNLNFIKFWKNYILAGLGIFVTLGLVYISAVHISSGMIAIIFALTPLITGVIANIILQNKEFDRHKLFATLLGFAGMVIIFFEYQDFTLDLHYLFLLFVAMSFQAFVSVKLKSLKSSATALQTTTGGILISVPLFLLSFLMFETDVPAMSTIAVFSTVYLALFGSVLGFVSYYYLIQHVSVLTVGIIPLITPIFALILGYYANDEVLTYIQIIGFVVVSIALMYYQFYKKII
jgi:drug/metabolite transporter (DMT)-like permease